MKQISFLLLILLFSTGCRSKKLPQNLPDRYDYNMDGEGPVLTIEFTSGTSHNHPLMAIWVEDLDGNFIQTLFVAESIGKGVFKHGDTRTGKWLPGELRRPAALPVWAHHRGIKAEDGLFLPSVKEPVADAVTGPTPPHDFILTSRLNRNDLVKFFIFFEINQTWDWNEYWTNNKYPENEEYKTSAQPALVYKAEINTASEKRVYSMQLVGHSHYAGENGNIYEDLSTITTARNIAEDLKVIVGRPDNI